MNQEQVLKEITEILNQVLDRTDVILEETTKAKDIEGWDSLNHAIFIGDIQQHFKVKFTLREVLNLKEVSNICALVLQRIQKS
jgi:acyl carrier protein